MEDLLETQPTIDLAHLAVDLIGDKKGETIVLLDLQDISQLTDYFVIANATNERQLNAISDYLREEVKKRQGVLPWRVEGKGDSGWVLMDYGNVVIHLFLPEVRSYYDLEGLWRDGRVIVRVQ